MGRLLKIGDYAAHKNVRILVDAEHSYFQPAISQMTLALMKKYFLTLFENWF